MDTLIGEPAVNWAALAPTDEQMQKWKQRADRHQQTHELRVARERTRRKDLEHRRTAIKRALDAYRNIDNPDVTAIRIREGFIWTNDPRRAAPRPAGERLSLAEEVQTRPPMTRLVERRRHSLHLLMTMFYVARMETSPGRLFINDHPNIIRRSSAWPWLTLSGLDEDVPLSQRRNLRRTFNTAVQALADQNLVGLTGDLGRSGRYDGFTLKMEDGSGDPYIVPADDFPRPDDFSRPVDLPRRGAISLSTSFLLHGWHLVLTDLELATFLAIIHRTEHLRNVRRSDEIIDRGVDLKESERVAHYGLSGEAYNSVHMLARLGLIKLEDPMPNRYRPDEPEKKPDDESTSQTTAEAVGTSEAQGENANGAQPDGGDSEKAESNKRVAYRLIYPVEGREFGSAVDTLLDTLAR